MSLNTDHIKLIFGLKLKQLRQEKGMSLNDLSALSGISMSYINEIEKGKKYPKADKISTLAESLGSDYDSMVSLKLSKKLEPLSNLLKSRFLTDIPFDFFGIDAANLLEMLSDAPTKLSAFINTIIKIGRSYNMSVEQLYFSVLRSYQEMHNNYFPEIEKIAEDFLLENKIPLETQLDEFYLTNYLSNKYGIKVEYFNDFDYPNLASVRTLYIPKSKKVLINKRITSDQRAFSLAREIGFQYMNLKIRPLTSTWVEVNSFDEVFNNFQASYFAGAILIKKQLLENSLIDLFAEKLFSAEKIQQMVKDFQTTPETLVHRIFSVLPQKLNIDRLFFLRFEAPIGSKNYNLTKEIHLYKQHDPQESKNENYCRRWVSIHILDELSLLQSHGEVSEPLIKAQVSDYVDVDNHYFIISIARPMNIIENTNVSVSLGIEITPEIKAKIAFLDDPTVPKRTVNQTCEKCAIFDCKERVAAPTILQKNRQRRATLDEIKRLS